MRDRLRINMKRRVEKNQIRRRLISWLLITIILFVALPGFAAYLAVARLDRYPMSEIFRMIAIVCVLRVLLLLPPFIIMDLHFCRIVTFIEMMRHRYRSINRCLRNFHNFTPNDFLDKPTKCASF